MRLALGYQTPLPETWGYELKGVKDWHVPPLLPIAFPGRHIKVWHVDTDEWGNGGHYQGQGYSYTLINDLYLTAFTYQNKDATMGHAVVGEPYVYDGFPTISLIWAVSMVPVETCPTCAAPLSEELCAHCDGVGSTARATCPHDEPTWDDCRDCNCDCIPCNGQGGWFVCPACGWRSTSVEAIVPKK